MIVFALQHVGLNILVEADQMATVIIRVARTSLACIGKSAIANLLRYTLAMLSVLYIWVVCVCVLVRAGRCV